MLSRWRADPRQQRSEWPGRLHYESAKPLSAHYEALIDEHGDREPDCVAGGVVLGGQIRLTGQSVARLQYPAADLIPQPLSDLLVLRVRQIARSITVNTTFTCADCFKHPTHWYESYGPYDREGYRDV